jgi:hypothetical protein
MSSKIKSQSDAPWSHKIVGYKNVTEVTTKTYEMPILEYNPDYLEYIATDENCAICKVRRYDERYQAGWAKWYFKHNQHICDGCKKWRTELVKIVTE